MSAPTEIGDNSLMTTRRSRAILGVAAVCAALAGFWLARELDSSVPELASGTWLPRADNLYVSANAIREAAVIYVNEQRAGSLWCPPYALDVTNELRPGRNKIKIIVANLALNYMAGRRLPDYRLLNLRYGERFQAQDMDKVQAIPSGLFGPIRLFAESR